MKLRRFVLFLLLLVHFSGCSFASINEVSEYKQNNVTKYIYHVEIFDSTFATEDKSFFENNSVVTAMNSE